jgi:hypothetical protein
MRAITATIVTATTLASSACYSMRPVTLDALGAERASRVWVTHPDRSVVIMSDVQVFRGKLAGFVDGKYRELAPADLQQMRVRKLAAGRTVSLIAASALAATLVAVVLSGTDPYLDPCAGDEDNCEGQ